MTVRVLFFASLREAVGEDTLDVTLAPGATLAALRAALARQLSDAGATALADAEVRIAVNQQFVHRHDAPLAAGDEVAFLPPVTGG